MDLRIIDTLIWMNGSHIYIMHEYILQFCQLNICNFLNLYVYQLVSREASESLIEPSYNKVESARYL